MPSVSQVTLRKEYGVRSTLCFAGIGTALLLGQIVSWSAASSTGENSKQQTVALASRDLGRITRLLGPATTGQYSCVDQNSLACPLNDVQDPKQLKPDFTACGEVRSDWQVFCCVQNANNTYDGTSSYDNRPCWKSKFAVPPEAVSDPTNFEFIASYIADDFSDCVEIRKNVKIDDDYDTDCDCGTFTVAAKPKLALATVVDYRVKIKKISIGDGEVTVKVRVDNARLAGRVDVQLRTWMPGSPPTRVADGNASLPDQSSAATSELTLTLASTLKKGDYIVFANAKGHKPDVRRIALNRKDIPQPE